MFGGNKGTHHKKAHYKHRPDKSIIAPLGGDKPKEPFDDDNTVMRMFRDYASELDAKHDRHERIVKAGRDITIESKRIIFLLHTAATDVEHKRAQIFSEASVRLHQLAERNFKTIAVELEGQDSYLYLRAYTAGLQEYVEALLYHQFLSGGGIEPYERVEERFRYVDEEDAERKVALVVPQPEFFLGLADFTGELMRRCINNLGSGNIDDCFRICNYVKDIYTGFLSINSAGHKELGRKLYVLKQSLAKMEYVCYNIQVRGSEMPKHMLATVLNAAADPNHDEDEGYF